MTMTVDRAYCIACEGCVAVCPTGAIEIVAGAAYIKEESCISCGACVSECPEDAITAKEKRGVRL